MRPTDAFFAQLHAFIQALGDHHGALHAEAQLARGVLLQLAGGKWRQPHCGGALSSRRSGPSTSAFSSAASSFFGFFLVGTSNVFFGLVPDKARVKRRRLRARQVRIDGPVFFLLERLDLALALDDQPQRHGLHASGGKPAADFVPKQRRDLVTHKAVEHAACLLRVDQVAIDVARMLEGFLHGLLGDFVEGDALNAWWPSFFFFLPSIGPRPVLPPGARRWLRLRGPGQAPDRWRPRPWPASSAWRDLFFPGITSYSVAKSFSRSTPSVLLGRSLMCPSEASTSKPLPRYFWIVFALAGDSTMTKPLDNGTSSSFSYTYSYEGGNLFRIRLRH